MSRSLWRWEHNGLAQWPAGIALFLIAALAAGISGRAWAAEVPPRALPGQDSLAADSTASREIGDVVEEHAADERGEVLFEELSWLTEHPLDLNSVDAGELRRIPGVLSSDADALVRLRRRVGRFTSVEQLRRLPGDGKRLFYVLTPFVRVGPPGGFSLRTRSRWLWKQNTGDAASGAAQTGPPARELQRLDFRLWEGITAGAQLRRDAGEAYRYAFLSGYVRVPDLPGIDELLLGDLCVRNALGLVLGSSHLQAHGLIDDPPAGCRMEPYHGAGGRTLLRGAGASSTMRFPGWTVAVHALLSRVPLSTTLDSLGRIIAVDEDEAFTTASSAGRRHNASVVTAVLRGTVLSSAGAAAGVTLLGDYLSHAPAQAPSSQRPQRCGVIGVDGRFESGPVSLAAEWALANHGTALAGRIGLSPDRNTAVEILLWQCGATYWCSTSGELGAGAACRNSTGVRASWSGRISGPVTASASLEHWRRPWRTFRDPVPPSGVEGSVSLSVRVSPRLACQGRYSHSRSEQAQSGLTRQGLQDVEMAWVARDHVRWTMDLSPGGPARIRSRLDWCQAGGTGRQEGQKGWSLMHEIRLGGDGVPGIRAGVIIFETGSYASRLYIREADVDGAYTAPPCYGSGIRWYLLLRHTVAGMFVVGCKYASGARYAGPFDDNRPDEITLQVDMLAGSR